MFKINSIVFDETNIYCGGGVGIFAICNKSSFVFGDYITNPFGNKGTVSIYTLYTDDK